MEHIEEWLKTLSRSFGPPRNPVDISGLRRLYLEGEITKIIGAVKNSMIPVSMKLQVGYVNSGGDPAAPAWIETPDPFPPLHSRAFRMHTFRMFIRKSFIAQAPLDSLVSGIAHELAHIVLRSVNHVESNNEKFVDLTAMHFGYDEMFVKGHIAIRSVQTRMPERIPGYLIHLLNSLTLHRIVFTTTPFTKYGYLSEAEIIFAHQRIRETRQGNF